VPSGVQRFLVQRCGTNCVDLPGLSQLYGASQVLVGCVAADRRELTPRQPFGNEFQVDTIGDAERKFRVGGIVDRVNLQLGIDNAPGLTQATRIANDQRATTIVKVGVTKAFYNDLRPDARGVAHRDANGRQGSVLHKGKLIKNRLDDAVETRRINFIFNLTVASELKQNTSGRLALKNRVFFGLWLASVVSGVCVAAHDIGCDLAHEYVERFAAAAVAYGHRRFVTLLSFYLAGRGSCRFEQQVRF
jgi:hypothetical protein